MAENRARQTWHYRPGEIVVAVELPDTLEEQRQAHVVVRQAVEQHLAGSTGGVFRDPQSRPDPIVFRSRSGPPLGFLFYELDDATRHDTVKSVVSATHAGNLAALQPIGQAGLTPLGVMPHWLGSAQSNYSDGSPASLPRPAQPPTDGRWRYRYTAREKALDFRTRLGRISAEAQVPVLVLDTNPDWTRARRQAARFGSTNAQLVDMVDLLAGTALPEWHTAALRERDAERLKLASTPDGRLRGHEMADHGLFVAGLIHDLSPRTELRLRPVLNRYGVGDLHLLLRVLQDVVASKPQDDPLVINMSLGFLPKLEHLPWLWYGIQPPSDPDFVSDVGMPGEARDVRWLATHRDDVATTNRLLQGGLDRLSEYLLANNCLSVAAAGNDSLRRVEAGRPRLGTRVPARFRSVLGVAATTRDPHDGAAYSNVGDEFEFGDHIATFGGGITDNDEPEDGVVGVYTAHTFPAGQRGSGPVPNESGWAAWSGTSFSTAIASGLVSGYWAVQRARNPGVDAETVLADFHAVTRTYAPSLRTASIAMTGEWQSAN